MFNFISQHQAIASVVAYIVVMNAVMSMDSPDEKSGKGYRWLWKFSHGVILVLPRIFPALRWGGNNGNGLPPEPSTPVTELKP